RARGTSRAARARPRGTAARRTSAAAAPSLPWPSGEQEPRLVDALEHRHHAPVGGERVVEPLRDAAIRVAIERALEQPIAQEQERGLRHVHQTVVFDELDLAPVVQALDLAAVDADL